MMSDVIELKELNHEDRFASVKSEFEKILGTIPDEKVIQLLVLLAAMSMGSNIIGEEPISTDFSANENSLRIDKVSRRRIIPGTHVVKEMYLNQARDILPEIEQNLWQAFWEKLIDLGLLKQIVIANYDSSRGDSIEYAETDLMYVPENSYDWILSFVEKDQDESEIYLMGKAEELSVEYNNETDKVFRVLNNFMKYGLTTFNGQRDLLALSVTSRLYADMETGEILSYGHMLTLELLKRRFADRFSAEEILLVFENLVSLGIGKKLGIYELKDPHKERTSLLVDEDEFVLQEHGVYIPSEVKRIFSII